MTSYSKIPQLSGAKMMSFLPLVLTGGVAYFIYAKFIKDTPAEQAEKQAEALIQKNTVDSSAQSSSVVDIVKAKNAVSKIQPTSLHVGIADGFFAKLRGAYPSSDDMDSISKSIANMQLATLRLVVESYGIREKTVAFWDIKYADSPFSSICTGNLVKHIQASMSPLQISKCITKLNQI